MTYIEFQSKYDIENVCSCIVHAPDKVIIIGSDKKKVPVDRYSSFFAKRNKKVEFVFQPVNKIKVSEIADVLRNIIENEPDCCFDITGGDETSLFALGMVFEEYRRKGRTIQIHKVNITNGIVYDCDGDGNIIASNECPNLTVKENIFLHGGKVKDHESKEIKKAGKAATLEIKETVESLWSVCREYGVEWNKLVKAINANNSIDDEKAELPFKLFSSKLNPKERIKDEILRDLSGKCLITLKKGNNSYLIDFKNDTVKKCLFKEGQTLEFIVYFYAAEAKDKDESLKYNDVLTGVTIDWDGIINESPDTFDLMNEIDVIAMKSMVPIFISCKNGSISSDELFKLREVTKKFGGKYARMALISTSGDLKNEVIKERAKALKIKLINPVEDENDKQKTDEKFKKDIKNLYS